VASGRAIVATWRPHECTVLEALRDLGLDRQIIFNKNAGMILPSGVNKASGLTAALEELKISHHNVVSIGDAENDLPMLTQCECGVPVSWSPSMNGPWPIKQKRFGLSAASSNHAVEVTHATHEKGEQETCHTS
jgi:3-deoxy-D-manno-octulosonate 8-phosphate phosphatase KdsC-like HAD superfamily phosphatase